ncbi:MAG: efflux RND transporter periplasmic adaptor subunit [Bacteroidia bacterium]|nr:efflux RND transporter periplasmic adaptor subunit [Bacteroidia bacterium]
MKTKIIIAISVVAIVVLWMIAGKKKSAAVKVTTEQAEKRDIVESVAASGRIYPEVEVKISSDVSGEIIELLVAEGDTVKQGQLLCRINPELYESAMEQMRATLNNAKAGLATYEAQVSRAKASFKQQEANFKRQQKLFEEKVISASEFESAEAAYTMAKAEYETADKNVLAAKFTVESTAARLEESQRNYGRTSIYSPINGIVTSLSVEKGERVVGTSQMAGTEMMRISQFDFVEVRVDVNENDIIRIKKGDSSVVEVDAYKGQKFKGVVSQVARSMKSTAGVSDNNQAVNYEVRVRILPESYQTLIADGNNLPFLPGMTASVDIVTKVKKDVLSVPVSSVTMRNADEFGKDSIAASPITNKADRVEAVFIEKAGKVFVTRVTTGIQDGNYIQILTGVKEGDKVVTGPYGVLSNILQNDMQVEVAAKGEVFKLK